MISQAEIHTRLENELASNLSTLLPGAAAEAAWFNEGQARLQWYKHDVLEVDWLEGDVQVTFDVPVVEVIEVLYGEDNRERRWQPVRGGLQLEDYDGAEADGDAKVIVKRYWTEVDGSTSSELGPDGDSVCISYCLYKFFRRLAADRSVYQRYATLMGENGVSIDDLSDLADDHYRDYLDGRADLPAEPAVVFYPED